MLTRQVIDVLFCIPSDILALVCVSALVLRTRADTNTSANNIGPDKEKHMYYVIRYTNPMKRLMINTSYIHERNRSIIPCDSWLMQY